MAQGTAIGAFGLTEAQAGSDAAAIKTTAVRDGDHFVINGAKVFITNGDIADIMTVMAVTDPALGAVWRHHGLHRRDRHARLQHRHPRKQDGHPRQFHGRDRL